MSKAFERSTKRAAQVDLLSRDVRMSFKTLVVAVTQL